MDNRATTSTRRKNTKNRLAFLSCSFTFLLIYSIPSAFRLVPDHHEGNSEHNSVRIDQQQPFLFPRWNFDDQQDNDLVGSSLLSNLVEFAHGVVEGHATTIERPKTRSRWPEILYVVDRKGVWVSRAMRKRSWRMGLSRIVPVETMLQIAWQMLVMSEEDSSSLAAATTPAATSDRWPMLKGSLSHEGTPFFLWYGDYTSCNRYNWITMANTTSISADTNAFYQQTTHRSIPLLTASAPINCARAFPFPNYGTLQLLQKDLSDWDRYFHEHNTKYPWESKVRQVVWRGSLSAPNDDFQSVRWRLCRLVTDLSVSNSKDKDAALLFDVGLVEIPSRHDHLHLNVSLVGGLKDAIRPMHAYQQYKAILDVDGNSWSSRFATLLCSSSIVAKVQPMHVEYFYPDLRPWKHYIPIQSDLSDLIEHVRFVLDDRNEATVRAIIQNANDWCRTRLTHNATAAAMLDILETYANVLSSSSALRGTSGSWMEQWEQAKPGIFADDAFEMSLIRQI